MIQRGGRGKSQNQHKKKGLVNTRPPSSKKKSNKKDTKTKNQGKQQAAPKKHNSKFDEEIDDDDAFDSADEALYGEFFKNKKDYDEDEEFDYSEYDDEGEEGGMLLSEMFDDEPSSVSNINLDDNDASDGEDQEYEYELDDDDIDSDDDVNTELWKQSVSSLDNVMSERKKAVDTTIANSKKQIARSGEFGSYDDQMNSYSIGANDDDNDDDFMGMFSGSSQSGTLTMESLMQAARERELESDDSEDEVALPTTDTIDSTHTMKLWNKMSNVKEAQKIEVMADVRSERMLRQVAHEATVKDVSKWETTIENNKKSPALRFPLNSRNKVINSTTSIVKDYAPANPLEHDFANILTSLNISPEETAKREEELMLESKLTKEEMEERFRKARQLRELTMREQEVNKRLAKIKSKNGRKLKKKLKEQNELSLEELREIDPEAAAKKEDQLLKQRAAERMSLSSKNSKFAKEAKKMGKYKNVKQKEAYQEFVRKHNDLRQKQMGLGDGDDDSEDEDKSMGELLDDVEELMENNSKDAETRKGVMGMAFMRRAEESQRAENQALIDDMRREAAGENSDGEYQAKTTISVSGKKSFGPSEDGDGSNIFSKNKKNLQVTDLTTKKPVASGFGGGMFEIDNFDEEGSEDEQPVMKPVGGGASAFAAIKAEHVKNTKLAQDIIHKKVEVKDDIEDSDNDVDEVSLKEEIDLSSNNKKKNKKGKKGVLSELNTASVDEYDGLELSDDESNPWMTANDTTTKSESLDRINKTGAKTQKGTFKHETEQAAVKKQVNLNHENASDVVLDLSTPVLADHASNVTDKKDERYDGGADDVNLLADDEQAKLVQMAFSSGIDELENFEKMKMAEINADMPEEDPFAAGVPGWGSWGGAAVKKSSKQKKKENALREAHKNDIASKRDAILSARTDKDLKGVLINQKKDKKALAFQIEHIPYPFTSREQYERSLRVPLGPEWNTTQSFQKLNTPTVATKVGQIIAPIKWTKGMQKSTEAEEKAKEQRKRKAQERIDKDSKKAKV